MDVGSLRRRGGVGESGIERSIRLIRGQKVLLDQDLASLYGVSVKRLNEQVRRNLARFPEDFMFQLVAGEADSLRSQLATLKKGRGEQKYDGQFRAVVEALRELMTPARKPGKRIGFQVVPPRDGFGTR